MALTALLAVGLSFLPLPDSLRPLPDLRELPPSEAAISYTWPKALKWYRDQNETPLAEDPALALEAEAENLPESLSGTPTPGPGPKRPPSVTPSAANVFTRSIAGLPVHDRNRARELEATVRRIGAKHVDIIEGCRKGTGSNCQEKALDPFFDAISGIAAGTRKEHVRVIHLGDSLIASDHISDIIRDRLAARHGNGGRGFLFVDRPTRGSGRKVRVGDATDGWEIVKITDKAPPPDRLGFSGVSFIPRSADQRTRFDVASASVAELFYLAKPNGGALAVKADGNLVAEVRTSYRRNEVSYARVALPSGVKTLEVAPIKGDVEVFGVALETGKPGLILDSIGLPGATAEVYLRPTQAAFATQLQRRNPALVLIMLGGNEAHELGKGWTTMDKIRDHTRELIRRVRAAAPEASCLVTAPMDAGVPTVGRRINVREGSRAVGDLQKTLALEAGCAYWDTLESMGGEGSIVKWVQAELMLADLVHPRGRGADVVGHLFDLSLERSRLSRLSGTEGAATPAPGGTPAPAPAEVEDATGLDTSSGAPLTKTLTKLRQLQKDKKGRVAVVHLGASHTASHFFTDEVRARLARSFPLSGRGYVAFGRPSTRLAPSGVKRSLDGDWDILDALESPPGGAWGLTGVRAEGKPGARASVTFCDGCAQDDVPGAIELYTLDEPGMSPFEVRVDGKLVGAFPESPPKKAEVRIRRFPVKGPAHTIELKNVGKSVVRIFGAAQEMESPGLVLDALGAPSATIFTPAAFDSDVFTAQLKGRRADLYVLFYGTNEAAMVSLSDVALRESYKAVLGSLRAASPSAECLVLGPTDRVERRPNGEVAEVPHLALVTKVLREIAREEKCAYWSPRAAMGGPGSMVRWQKRKPPLGHKDGVHLTEEGYGLLARAFVDDLMRVYSSEAPPAAQPQAKAHGSREAKR